MVMTTLYARHAAKSIQSCPTQCNPIDGRYTLLHIKRWTTGTYCVLCELTQSLSHVRLFAILWTVTCLAPLSMEFSRQEYWSWSLFPTPGDLPNPESNPCLVSLLPLLYH